MTTLQPFQLRVVEERDELAVRLERLRLFLGTNACTQLPEMERDLLVRQLGAMVAYRMILDQRIALF